MFSIPVITHKQIHSPLVIKLLGQKDTLAITLWPFIFTKEKEISRTVLEHEKIHLKQQLRGWIIGFYIKYLYYQVRYGYEKNPYEIEAQNKETNK